MHIIVKNVFEEKLLIYQNYYLNVSNNLPLKLLLLNELNVVLYSGFVFKYCSFDLLLSSIFVIVVQYLLLSWLIISQVKC